MSHCDIHLQMEKTEKTMAELEIDQNVKFEWDSITEAGAALKPLSGPGYAFGTKSNGHPSQASDAF
jgi:ubiquitin carboxyl-terminal hydrolase 5/13